MGGSCCDGVGAAVAGDAGDVVVLVGGIGARDCVVAVCGIGSSIYYQVSPGCDCQVYGGGEDDVGGDLFCQIRIVGFYGF